MATDKENAAKKNTAKKATVLGDFKLIKKLGEGGMGTVYLGHQESLDRPCAVKVLSKEFAAKPGFVDRFIREARAMAKINHPNVVDCYAVGEDKKFHYVAMELMDGQSMQDWTDQLGTLSVADAVAVTLVCADALHYAHEMSMIHRDVKPDNVLVTKSGLVKVSDMGLAKAIDEDDMGLTQSGTGLGTPHYMAPEQARNAKHVDRRVDVYALGCTLYHFLTGKTPFTCESMVELIVNKEKGKFTSARRINPQVPERLDLIVDKAMAAKPEHRYQTCAEMITDLEALGLAGEVLSFIDEEMQTPIRRTASPSRATLAGNSLASSPAPAAKKSPATSPKRSQAQSSSGSASTSDSSAKWFVKHEGSEGKIQIGKMTVPQILQAMKGDKLNLKTQVAMNAKGPFLPLSQVPVFEDEARRMVTRQTANAKNTSLANEYEKLAKQYERRKWWQSLRRLVDGTLGFVGLLIWLAVIAAVCGALYFVIPMLFDKVADGIGLEDPNAPPPAVAPENETPATGTTE